jgi:hypothetical protein
MKKALLAPHVRDKIETTIPITMEGKKREREREIYFQVTQINIHISNQ